MREIVHKDEDSSLNYKSLIEFSQMNKFKKSVLTFVASRINNNDLHQLRESFHSIDTNEDGFISCEELQSAFEKMKVNDVEIKKLFDEIDYNKNGFINWTEFLAATIDKNVFLTENKLYEAFRMFDKDNSGKISKEEISQVLEKDGGDMKYFEDMVHKYDANNDGEIDYNEFCEMMGKKLIEDKNTDYLIKKTQEKLKK